MAEARFKVDINKNKTKKGIKIQFALDKNISPDERDKIAQKLHSKLSSALEPLGLNINDDTDIQFSNVVGFLILLADIKLMIKNALNNGNQQENPGT